MSEEVVTNTDITSIDPESIGELWEFRCNAIDIFVGSYAQNFDKVFVKFTENLTENEEKLKKFKEIREKHLKEYENYVKNCLERQMRQFFADKQTADKLVYISENFVKFPDDLITVHSAVGPIRTQFIQQLRTFEETLDERHESKTKTLNELTENVTKAYESYESLRKSVQKKALTIIKDIESIEVQDLD